MLKLLFLTLILLGNLVNPPTQRKSDRERDGLIGPVKSVSASEAEFDFEDGKLVEGKRELSSEDQYNEIGQLLSHTYFQSGEKKGEILFKESHRYDTTGRLIETTTVHSKFTYLPDKKTYSYDDKGRLTEERAFDVNGASLGMYSYTYDAAGNAIEEKSTGDNKLYFGNWLKKRKYNVDGRVLEESSYQEEAGNLVPYDFRMNYYKRVNFYDSKGRLVGTNYFGTDEKVYRTNINRFDDKGNETEETTFHADGTIESRETYSYEFDQQGNSIKDTTYEWTTEDGKSFFRPKEVTYRTITYFKTSGRRSTAESGDADRSVLQNTETEDYAVYRAILSQRANDDGNGLLVIQRFTEGYNTDDPEKRSGMTTTNLRLRGVSQAVIDDYVAKNQNRQYELLKDRFGLKRTIELVSQNELTALFGKSCERGWQEFYKRYPHSGGYTTVSRVGFSSDGTHALVYVSSIGGCLGGSGNFVVLARENGIWIVKSTSMIWIS